MVSSKKGSASAELATHEGATKCDTSRDTDADVVRARRWRQQALRPTAGLKVAHINLWCTEPGQPCGPCHYSVWRFWFYSRRHSARSPHVPSLRCWVNRWVSRATASFCGRRQGADRGDSLLERESWRDFLRTKSRPLVSPALERVDWRHDAGSGPRAEWCAVHHLQLWPIAWVFLARINKIYIWL